MKWIGQHIWDFISRFRSKVYLEDVANAGSDTDAFLVKKSDGEIAIRTGSEVLSDIGGASSASDITAVTITTDSGGGSAASDTSGSADFSILGSGGVGVTNSGTTITATAVPGEIDHDSLLNFAANEHFTQANITGTGTITSGTWNGTAIASAYLDADTAHLSGTQTFTGKKQIDKRTFSKTADGTHFEVQGDILYFGGGSTTIGDLCFLQEDGEWGRADADGAAGGDDADRDAMGMLAIALGTDPDVDGMLLRGTITMDYDLGDVGNPVYVSTTGGSMTSTAPSASGDFVRVVGYCLSDAHGCMWFNPDSAWVEIG
tara:strand:- start:146 stop:1096 length:951 start_codon:yes stop_codon:yes gene_type:complete